MAEMKKLIINNSEFDIVDEVARNAAVISESTASALGLSDATVDEALGKMESNVQLESITEQTKTMWVDWEDASGEMGTAETRVLYFDGYWFAFKNSATLNGGLLVSNDGVTWTTVSVTTSSTTINANRIACNEDTLLVGFGRYSSYYFKKGSDPTKTSDWKSISNPDNSSTGSTGYYYMPYSDGKYIYWLSNTGGIHDIYSPVYRWDDDNNSWTTLGIISSSYTELFGSTRGQIASDGAGTLLAMGKKSSNTKGYIYKSTDYGSTWNMINNTRPHGSDVTDDIYLYYSNGYFYFVREFTGSTAYPIYKTADGVSFTEVANPCKIGYYCNIQRVGEYWVADGIDESGAHRLCRSVDFENWEIVNATKTDIIGSKSGAIVVYGNDEILFSKACQKSYNDYITHYQLLKPDATNITEKVMSALGLPGVKIELGSYAGTGTYSESASCSLTFGFVPKMVWLYGYYTGNYFYQIYADSSMKNVTVPLHLPTDSFSNSSGVFYSSTSGYNYGKRSVDGKTIYWYNSSNATNCYNESGCTYYYIAIG